MYEVHGVKMSHQTISNYRDAVAPRIKPFIDHFPYDLSDSHCGDETYIKVGGRWHYVFFFFGAVKRIIKSYRVQRERDYRSAILAINDVLVKLKEIPENLNFIKGQQTLEIGEIGIFELNGDAFVKKLGHGEFISLDPRYTPIKIREFDSLRVLPR